MNNKRIVKVITVLLIMVTVLSLTIMLSACRFSIDGGGKVTFEKVIYMDGDTQLTPEGAPSPDNYSPTKDGHSFIGWALTPDGSGKFDSNTYQGEEIVLYAMWSVNWYKVKFVDHDGTVLQVNDADEQLVAYKSTAVLPDEPNRYGYTFIGWDKDYTSITEDTLLTAVYERTLATVKLHCESKVVIEKDDLYVGDSLEGFFATCSSALKEYTSNGLSIVGWFEDAELTHPIDVETAVAGDVTDVYPCFNVISNSTLELQSDSANDTYAFSENLSVGVSLSYTAYKRIEYSLVWFVDDQEIVGETAQNVEINGLAQGRHIIKVKLISTYNNSVVTDEKTLDILVSIGTIRLKADDISVKYGDALPTFSYSVVDGDAIDLGNIRYTTSYSQGNKAGTYTISINEFKNDLYELVFVDGTLTVEPKPVTVTANTVTLTYGDELPNVFTYTVNGRVSSDDAFGTATASCIYGAGSNVGSYSIEISGLENPNYTITQYINGELIVNPRELDYKVVAKDIIFGEEAVFSYKIIKGELFGSDSLGTPTYDTEYTKGSDIKDDYAVTLRGLSNSNYTLPSEKTTSFKVSPLSVEVNWTVKGSYEYNGLDQLSEINASFYDINNTSVALTIKPYISNAETLFKNAGTYDLEAVSGNKNYTLTANKITRTITPKNATVIIDSAATSYGEEAPLYNASESGLCQGDSLDYTIVCNYSLGSDKGEYDIDAVGTFNSNYNVTVVKGTLSVSSKSVYVEWTGDNDYTYSGLDMRDNVTATIEGYDGALITLTPQFTLDGEISNFKNAGTYAVTVSLDNENYTLNDIERSLYIFKKDLTVTTQNATTVYGSAAPKFVSKFDGFVNNENESVLDGTLTHICSYGVGYSVNEYDIRPLGLSSDNYEIEYVSGTLTVTPLSVAVKWNIASSYIYNGKSQKNGVTAEFRQYNGIDKKVDLSFDGDFIHVGEYNVEASIENDNYTLTDISRTIAISPKALQIKAKNIDVVYGSSIPSSQFGYTNTALATGDSISSVDYDSSAYSVGANVGSYVLKVSNAVVTNSSDYTVSYVDGVITVGKLSRNVKWNIGSYTYNGLEQSVGATYSTYDGNVVDLDVSYVSVSDRTNTSFKNAGKYTVTAKALSDDVYASNYDFNVTSKTAEISPKSITVSVNALAVSYGDGANFTYSAPELIEGDELSDIVYECSYAIGSDIGTYPISITNIVNDNYSITTQGAFLTVNAKNVDLDWTIESSYVYNGNSRKNDIVAKFDDIRNVSQNVTLTFSGELKHVGNYSVVASYNDNYSFNNAQKDISITRKPITVTVNNSSVVYGNNASFSYSAPELISGDVLSNVTYAHDYSIGSDVGDYTVSISAIENSDYEITKVSGTLTVTQRPIEIVWESALSYTYTGNDQIGTVKCYYVDIDNNNVSLLENIELKNAGNYTLTAKALSDNNYKLSDTAQTQHTLSIAKKEASVTIGTKSVEYGWNILDYSDITTVNGAIDGESIGAATSTYVFGSPVNTYTVSFTANEVGNTNYNISVSKGSLNVTPRTISSGIVWSGDNGLIYNGLSQKETVGATFTDIYGVSKSLNLSYAFNNGSTSKSRRNAVNDGSDFVNAGTYTVTLSYDGNYTFTVETRKEIKIEPKKVTVTVTVPQSVTYGDSLSLTAANSEYDWVYSGDVTKIGNIQYTYGGNSSYNASTSAGTDVVIVASGYSNSNYTFEYKYKHEGGSEVKDTITINVTKRTASVVWTLGTYTYNGSDQKSGTTATFSDVDGNDIPMTVVYPDSFKDEGEYELTATNTNANYSYTNTTIIAEIGAKSLTVNVHNKETTYGENAPSFTFNATGIIAGDVIGTYSYTTDYQKGSDVGGYYIKMQFSAINHNYSLNVDESGLVLATATLTVKQRAVTVSVQNKGIIFGDSIPTYTAVVTSGSLYADQTVADLGNFVCAYTDDTTQSNSWVKDYIIGFDKDNDNYDVTVQNGTLTVSKKTVSVEWAGINAAGHTYNGAIQDVITAKILDDVSLIISYQGSNSDNDSFKNADSYTLTASLDANDSNYTFYNTNYLLDDSSITESATINPKDVEITVDNKNVVYGHDISIGLSVYGVVEGENIHAIVNFTYTPYSTDVGTYSNIGATYDSNSNYAVTVNKGSLTVTKQSVAVVWNLGSYTYNGSDQKSGTTATYTPYNKTAVSMTVNYPDSFKNAGTDYTLSATATDEENSNFTFTNSTATATIDRKLLTISVKKPDDIEFGDPIPTYDKTINGLVDGDTIGGELYCTYSVGSNKGTYDIDFVDYDNSNYDFAVNKSTLTVKAKSVSIVWESLESYIYNGKNRFDTVKAYYTAINGDKISLLNTQYFTNAGTYEFTTIANTNANYNVSGETSKTLTIAPASITVAVTNQELTYGADKPDISTIDKVSGIIAVTDGELFSTDLLSIGTLDYDYAKGDNANTSYPITYTLVSSNYTISNSTTVDGKQVVRGNVSVGRKSISEVTWIVSDNYTYNGQEQSVNAKFKDINDDWQSLTISYLGQSESNIDINKFKDVDTYTLSVSYSDNYTFESSTQKTVAITQKTVNITINPLSLPYGDALSTIGGYSFEDYSSDIYVGDTVGTLSLTSDHTSTSDVGSYIITASGLNNRNYKFVYNTAYVTVTKRSTSIAVVGANAVYGSSLNDINKGTIYYGDVLEDDKNKLNITANYSEVYSQGKNVGKYDLTVTCTEKDGKSNYDITILNDHLTEDKYKFCVTVATVDLNWNVATYTYCGSTISLDGVVSYQTFNGTKNVSVDAYQDSNKVDFLNAGNYTLKVTANGSDDGNYVFSESSKTYSENVVIAYKELTIRVNKPDDIEFGADKPSSFTHSIDSINGLVTGESISSIFISSTYRKGDSVNDYDISIDLESVVITNKDGLNTTANYKINTVGNKLTVKAKSVTIVWESLESYTYNGENRINTVKAYYLDINNKEVSLLITKDFIKAGSYTFETNENTDTNYAVSGETSKTLTIAPAPITVSFKDNLSVEYGNTFVYTDNIDFNDTLYLGKTISDIGTFSGYSSELGAGEHEISYEVTDPNYVLANSTTNKITATLTITADSKTVKIVWTGFADSYTYANKDYKTGLSISAAYYTADGITKLGTLAVTYPDGEIKDAGSYTFTASVSSTDEDAKNYTFPETMTYKLKVAKRLTSIAVVGANAVYGTSLNDIHKGTIDYGNVLEDDKNKLNITANYSEVYHQGKKVGKYDLTVTCTEKDGKSNYDITILNDHLTEDKYKFCVTVATVDLNWNVATYTYCGSTISLDGVVSYQTFNGTKNVSVDAYQDSNKVDFLNAGNYTLKVTANGSDDGNYVFSESSKTYSENVVIAPKTVNLTVDSKSVTYGDDVPAYTFDVSGNINGESIGKITLSCDYIKGSSVKADGYPITATISDDNTNYSVNVSNSKLIVEAKPVTIVWESLESYTYNGENRINTVKAYYLDINNKEVSLLITKDFIKAGSYTFETNENTDTNYAVSGETSKTLTIAPAPITVSFKDNLSVEYGNTFVYTDNIDFNDTLYLEDTISTIGTFSGYTQGDSVGDRTIKYTLKNGNYEITNSPVVDGKYTNVITATLKVTADQNAVSIVWSGFADSYTYANKDYKTGLSISAAYYTADGITKLGTLAVTYPDGEIKDAGNYTFTASVISTDENAKNYTFPTSMTYKLTVAPASISISIGTHSIEYGSDEPVYANITSLYSISGDKYDDINSIGNFTCDYEKGSGVKDRGYSISFNKNNNNYTVSVTNGNLTVTPKVLTITANSHSVSFGAAVTYGFTPNGLIDLDNNCIAVSNYECNYVAGNTTTGKVGNYDITINDSAVSINRGGIDVKGNYAITYNKGSITVSAYKVTSIDWSGIEGVTYIYNGSEQGKDITASHNAYGGTTVPMDITFSGKSTTFKEAGDYIVTAKAPDTLNYDFSEVPLTQNLTIGPRKITITVDNQSVTYGNAAPEYTATYDDLIMGDTIGNGFSCTYSQGAPVAEAGYTIDLKDYDNNSNYQVTSYTAGKLTVTARPITVKVSSTTKTYGDAALTSTELISLTTITGLYGSDSVSNVGSTTCTYTQGSNVGSYPIVFTFNGNSNYTVTNATSEDGKYVVKGTLAVDKRSIIVTIGTPSAKTYGDAALTDEELKELTTIVDLDGNAITSNIGTTSCDYKQGNNAGSYSIKFTLNDSDKVNYKLVNADKEEISEVVGTLTVNKKSVTLNWKTDYTYKGTAQTPTATFPNALYVEGSTSIDKLLTANISIGDSKEFKNAGWYELTASEYANYTFTNSTQNVEIKKAQATITFSNTEVVMGNDFNYTYEVSGLCGDDKQDKINLNVSSGYDKDSTSSGTYYFTVTADNYTFNSCSYVVKGNISLDLVWTNKPDNDKLNWVYGENSISSISAKYTYEGSKYDAVISIKKNDASVSEIKNVGTYVISASSQPEHKNIGFNNGHFTITIEAKDVYINVGSDTIIYGAVFSFDSITKDVSEMAYGESLSNVQLQLYSGESPITYEQGTTGAGAYTIKAICGENDNPNYKVTVTNGTLTVKPYVTSVEWETTSFTYNGNDQSVTAKYTAYNGDKVEMNILSYLCTSTSNNGDTSFKNAGTYTVTAKAKTADELNNYTFTDANDNKEVVNDSVTIAAASITITIGTHEVTFGDSVPTYENIADIYSITSGTLYDSITAVGKFTCGYTATSNVNADGYDIDFKASNSNYSVTVVKGKLIVKPAERTLSWNGNSTYTYDGNAKTISASFTGITGQINLSASNLTCNIADVKSDSIVNVGTYKFTASYPNYTFTNAIETVTINPKEVVLSVSDVSVNYGDDYNKVNDKINSAFGISGLVSNSDIEPTYALYSGSDTFTYIKGTSQGTYTIKVTYTANANYKVVSTIGGDEITELTSNLTVDRKALTISATATTVKFGETLSFDYSQVGLIDIDSLNVSLSAYSVTDTNKVAFVVGNAETGGIGTYTIGIDTVTISRDGNSVSDNYDIRINTSILTVTAAQKELSWNSVSGFTYNGDIQNVIATFIDVNGNKQSANITYVKVTETPAKARRNTVSSESTVAFKDAGKYTAIASYPNYVFYISGSAESSATESVSTSVNIAPAPITVTITVPKTVVYGSSTITVANSYTAFGEDKLGTVQYTYGGNDTYIASTEVGKTVSIVAGGLSNSNYVISYQYKYKDADDTATSKPISVEVTKRDITSITWEGLFDGENIKSFTYGDVKFSSIKVYYTTYDDTKIYFDVSAYQNDSMVEFKNAGEYTLTASIKTGDTLANNYNFTASLSVENVVISPKTVSVVWSGLDNTFTYKGSEYTTITATVSTDEKATLTISYQGSVSTNTVFQNADTYKLTAKWSDDASETVKNNYTLSDITKENIRISAAPITVTISDPELCYGDSALTDTDMLKKASYTPLFESDSLLNIGTFSSTYTQGANANTLYTVSYSLTNTNYTLSTTVSTKFTVSKRSITIRIADISVEYGSAVPDYSEFTSIISGTLYPTTSNIDGIGAFTCDYTNTTSATTEPFTIGFTPKSNYSVNIDRDTDHYRGTLTVMPKTVSVEWNGINNSSYTYNGTDQHKNSDGSLSITAKYKLVTDSYIDLTVDYYFGSEIVESAKVTEFKNAGTYTLVAKFNGDVTNYELDSDTAVKNLTIAKKDLTITAENKSISFGATPEFTSTKVGLVNGDVASVEYACDYKVGDAINGKVGTYPITITSVTVKDTSDNNVTANYIINTGSGTLTVSAKEITVTFDSITKIYGDAALTEEELKNLTHIKDTSGKDLTGLYGNIGTTTCTYKQGDSVKDGGYPIVFTFNGNSNYNVTNATLEDSKYVVKGALAVDKRSIIVSIGTPSAKTYGDAALTEEELKNLTTIVDLYGNAITSNIGTTTCDYKQGNDAGSYSIKFTLNDSDKVNYKLVNAGKEEISEVVGTLTVNKKEIIVSIGTPSAKTYGDAALTEEELKSLTTIVDLYENVITSNIGTTSCDYKQGNNAGSYSIKFTLNDSDKVNYKLVNTDKEEISEVVGTLTVNKKEIIVSIGTPSAKIYGDAALTEEELKNLTTIVDLYGNAITSNIGTTTCDYKQGNDAGSYSIKFTLNDSDKVNYKLVNTDKEEISEEVGTLTVNAKTVSVKWSGIKNSYTYDGTDQHKNSDGSLSITAKYKLINENYSDLTVDYYFGSDKVEVTEFKNAGTYTLVAKFNGKVNNYSLDSTATKTLTIDQKAITITAEDKEILFGADKPKFTIIKPVLVSGDTIEKVTLTCGYETGKAVGNYDIVPSDALIMSGATDVTDNYYIKYENGTLSVTNTKLTIKVDDVIVTYGEDKPTFSFTSTGLVNGDKASVEYDCSYTVGDAVDKYTISITSVTVKDKSNNDVTANYTIILERGTLTVNKKEVAVVWRGLDKTFTYNGIEQTDGITATYDGHAMKVTFSGKSDVFKDAGDYNLTATPKDDDTLAANYTISGTTNAATINPQDVTITVNVGNDGTVEYGYDVAINLSVVGVVSVESIKEALDFTYTPYSTNVGNYTIGATYDTNNHNYSVDVISGTLEVTQQSVAVVWNLGSYTYNGSDQKSGTTASYTPYNKTAVSMTVNYPDSFKDAGKYTLTATPIDETLAANYTFTNESMSVSIDKAEATIVVDSASVTYGEAFTLDSVSKTIGLVSGESLSNVQLKLYNGENTITYVQGETGAGAYTIKAICGENDNPNYKVTVTNCTLTVAKRKVTVTMPSYDIKYGADVPDINTATLSNVYGSDTVGTVSGSTDYSKGSPIGGNYYISGTYTITNSNYELDKVVSGTIKVDKLSVSVDWTIGSYTYTGETYSVTAQYENIYGTKVDMVVTYKIDGNEIDFINAGTYTVEASAKSDDTLADNYSFTNNTQEVTIAKASWGAKTHDPIDLGDSYVYGKTLGDIKGKLAEGFYWCDEAIYPDVSESGIEYNAYYNPDNNPNYNPSYLTITVILKNRAKAVVPEKNITINTTYDPNIFISSYLSDELDIGKSFIGQYGKGYSWYEETDRVLNAGEYTLNAVYNPNPNNYENSEPFTIKVNVAKAEYSDSDIPTLKPIEGTYDPNKSLSSYNLADCLSKEDQEAGKGKYLLWKNDALTPNLPDNDSSLDVGKHEIPIFYNADTTNYEFAPVTLTIIINKAKVYLNGTAKIIQNSDNTSTEETSTDRVYTRDYNSSGYTIIPSVVCDTIDDISGLLSSEALTYSGVGVVNGNVFTDGGTYTVTVAVNEGKNSNFEFITDGSKPNTFTVKINSAIWYYKYKTSLASSKKTYTSGLMNIDDIIASPIPSGYYSTSDVTIIVAYNTRLNSSTIIPSDVTLLVPYSEDYDTTAKPTTTDDLGVGNAYSTLTITSWCNMDVKGTLNVSGRQYSKNSTVRCGHTIGNYGMLIIEESAYVPISSGKLYSYGYIVGKGLVELIESQAYEPLAIKDWCGGSLANSVYEKFFPFSQYLVGNIEARLIVNSKSTLYACYYIIAGSTDFKNDIMMIASDSKAMFQIESGAVEKAVVEVEDPNGVINHKVQFNVKGNVITHDISVKISVGISTITITTENKEIPICGYYDLAISSGTVTLNSRIKLLPGASFKLNSNASCIINSNGGLIGYGEGDSYVGTFTSSGGVSGEYYYGVNTNLYVRYASKAIYTSSSPVNMIIEGSIIVNDKGKLGGDLVAKYDSNSETIPSITINSSSACLDGTNIVGGSIIATCDTTSAEDNKFLGIKIGVNYTTNDISYKYYAKSKGEYLYYSATDGKPTIYYGQADGSFKINT